MTLVEYGRYAVAVALTGLLLWAAWTDVRVRLIRNVTVLGALGLWLVSIPVFGTADLLSSLMVGAAALVVCFLMFSFGVFGAGDAKLFAAVSLFAGVAYIGSLALATVVAGGLMALASLASNPQRALAMLAFRKWDRSGDRGIPYGVAIAAGGIIVIWGEVTGLLPPYSLLLLGR